MKLLCGLGRACSEYQDNAFRNLRCKPLQCDEISSFVGAKEKKMGSGEISKNSKIPSANRNLRSRSNVYPNIKALPLGVVLPDVVCLSGLPMLLTRHDSVEGQDKTL
jgi:hypothetical protein